MQAPQLRLNERHANPNPYIIFIRSLAKKKDTTDAEDILKAVAAQMKPIMKERFMQVHTLEEAEFNRVFAGRNWNHGQSIELVLRGPSGRFLPLNYIISVMCHEMAHIEQMNHGPKFQKLMAEIKADVRRLQSKGYYGDGFWSDGKRLQDSVRMGGESYRASDFPEYVCGVSASDARKAKRPSRGPGASRTPGLVKGEASHRSGRQTEYRRKAGRKNNADMGEVGLRLDGGRQITKEDREERKTFVDNMSQVLVQQGLSVTRARNRAGEMWIENNPWWKEGSTKGKVAKSKTAAEMRAAAAEARLRVLSDPSTRNSKPLIKEQDEDDTSSNDGEEDAKPVFDEEDEVFDPHIDAEERKREMEEDMDDEEREGLRGGWQEFVTTCGEPEAGASKSANVNNVKAAKRERSPSIDNTVTTLKQAKLGRPSTSLGVDLVRQERLRALGLASTSGSSRSRTMGFTQNLIDTSSQLEQIDTKIEKDHKSEDVSTRLRGWQGWECKLCTFINLADQGRCEMCQARPDGSMPEDVL
ncbi:uncharacterized protein IL334_001150 [Kwoniella shivajii]|uniref:WLM domain-containing protein n=1 Tax=Kwoniella shivajii TaxID=564305 RepID=A0ABZ1CU76_9TREE|nr:hypothetical protein IL334_001150 [Kwoniella shivajii]